MDTANENDPLVQSVRPANRSLVEGAAGDAASYFNRFHRQHGNINVLYRAMRTMVSLPWGEKKLFLQRWAELLDDNHNLH